MIPLRIRICSRLTLLLLGIGVGSASASDLESFAAQLLCEKQSECEPQPAHKESSPLVVLGQTLPADAARNVNDEQRYLVKQGAYMNKKGDIVPLSEGAVSLALPERGEIKFEDYGPADMIPLEGPVVITTPKGGHDE